MNQTKKVRFAVETGLAPKPVCPRIFRKTVEIIIMEGQDEVFGGFIFTINKQQYICIR